MQHVNVSEIQGKLGELYNLLSHCLDADDSPLIDLSVLIHHGRDVVAAHDDTKRQNKW